MRQIVAALFVSLAGAVAAAQPLSATSGPEKPFIGPRMDPQMDGPICADSQAPEFLSIPDLSEVPSPFCQSSSTSGSQTSPPPKAAPGAPVDKNGDLIPLERRQPQRILGFMPNFRTVSGGAAAHPPGFKYNFSVAAHQAFDYSSFIFLGLTSLTAEATNEHPALGKGVEGFGQYTWRGFLDKTDNTFLSAWILSTILREDTRYYALGAGHSFFIRPLYTISQQGVARTYGGHLTPNFAGLGAKALTQFVSRYYYPPSATTFGVLATKFGYSVMRDVAFSSVREFYPDINAHYIRKHQAKEARLAAKRAGLPPPAAPQAPSAAAPAK